MGNDLSWQWQDYLENASLDFFWNGNFEIVGATIDNVVVDTLNNYTTFTISGGTFSGTINSGDSTSLQTTINYYIYTLEEGYNKIDIEDVTQFPYPLDEAFFIFKFPNTLTNTSKSGNQIVVDIRYSSPEGSIITLRYFRRANQSVSVATTIKGASDPQSAISLSDGNFYVGNFMMWYRNFGTRGLIQLGSENVTTG